MVAVGLPSIECSGSGGDCDGERVVAEGGMSRLPVSLAHARAAGLLEWVDRDPFDRMLAAQALAVGAVLVTADPVFAGRGFATLWI